MPNTPRTPSRNTSKASFEAYIAFEDKNRYKKKFRKIPDDDILLVTKKLSFEEPELFKYDHNNENNEFGHILFDISNQF